MHYVQGYTISVVFPSKWLFHFSSHCFGTTTKTSGLRVQSTFTAAWAKCWSILYFRLRLDLYRLLRRYDSVIQHSIDGRNEFDDFIVQRMIDAMRVRERVTAFLRAYAKEKLWMQFVPATYGAHRPAFAKQCKSLPFCTAPLREMGKRATAHLKHFPMCARLLGLQERRFCMRNKRREANRIPKRYRIGYCQKRRQKSFVVLWKAANDSHQQA